MYVRGFVFFFNIATTNVGTVGVVDLLESRTAG